MKMQFKLPTNDLRGARMEFKIRRKDEDDDVYSPDESTDICYY
jgi:hypothetical protein